MAQQFQAGTVPVLFTRTIEDYREGWGARLRAFCYQTARNALLVYLVVFKGLRIQGQHNIPAPPTPFIVVANHVSNWDPPVVGSVLRGYRNVAFMAKKELMVPNPILNGLFNWLGTIPVDRESVSVATLRVAKQVATLPNWVLGVFPEGHRNVDGTAQAKKGAAFMARMTGCSILPIGIAYTPKGVRAHVGSVLPVDHQADLDRLTDELMATLAQLKLQAEKT
ncbi:MAG: lysophospholipid acyltransferase family protein [Vampirovibrionales bacterium]